MDLNLEHGIELFNNGEYFEAHEAFELFWKKYKGKDRPYYQALIQMTAAMHLIYQERYQGAKKTLERAGVRIKGARNKIMGVDLHSLYFEVRNYLEHREAGDSLATYRQPIIRANTETDTF
jgi:predicted metal-dependent hydrolase